MDRHRCSWWDQNAIAGRNLNLDWTYTRTLIRQSFDLFAMALSATGTFSFVFPSGLSSISFRHAIEWRECEMRRLEMILNCSWMRKIIVACGLLAPADLQGAHPSHSSCCEVRKIEGLLTGLLIIEGRFRGGRMACLLLICTFPTWVLLSMSSTIVFTLQIMNVRQTDSDFSRTLL